MVPLNIFLFVIEHFSTHDRVHRQLSVSSDSKLLDEDIREEARVILRPPKPPRPKSEVLLHQPDSHNRRTKRFSAFGVSTYYLILQNSYESTLSILLLCNIVFRSRMTRFV